MNIIHTKAYRDAFATYLRKGTPIHLTLKQAHLTNRYVWHSRRDGHVRPSHRMNDGRVFIWGKAPDTGHPGEDYNCRCEAVPYIAGATEFGFHDFTTSLASSHDRWTNLDFVTHYYSGSGRPVNLLEIGHLREIAEQYAYRDGAEGAFRRLSDQIADKAREAKAGLFDYSFSFFYDFGDVAFSHGDGTVSGVFIGVVEHHGDMLRIFGESRFQFDDIFADPLGLNIEPGGTPYKITGNWRASFSAEVFKNQAQSRFFNKGRK